MGRVKHAYYIGQSLVGGVTCNHLAFRGPDMDWQLWIEDGANPVPRRFVIIDRAVPGMPRYVAVLSDWNATPSFDAATFTFEPPAGATKIRFVPAAVKALRR
jgi:hypothetical protein